jgi:hypothetical protein
MVTKRLFSVLAAALMLSAAVPAAQARSVPGMEGVARNPRDSVCFSESYGSIVQSGCDAAGKDLFVPLVNDNAGWISPSVSVYAPDAAHTLGCQNWAVSSDLLTVDASGDPVYPSVFGVATKLFPGSVYVPSGGHLFTICWSMGRGTRVHNVIY